MNLRTRIAVTYGVVALPLVAALTWGHGALEEQAQLASLYHYVTARMEDGRATCEADPVNFPPRIEGSRRSDARPPPVDRRRPRHGRRPSGPPPHPHAGPPAHEPAAGPLGARKPPAPIALFAYSSAFVSANPHAPEFPASLRTTLEAGAARAGERFGEGERRGLHVAMRMPWSDGPCAVVLAALPTDRTAGMSPSQTWTAAALALVLAASTYFAAGPVVARVRRLTREVRNSAREGYASRVTVDGKDEIAQLARTFNEAGAEVQHQLHALEDRERALRSFVANTMHDVMIPMTVLKGHLGALRGVVPDDESPTLREAIEEAQYMSSILENLAVSARLEVDRPSLDVTDVELGSLVQRVVARHSPVALQKRIELHAGLADHPPTIRADLTLLEQAVSNVVHNAVRYTPEGGHVAVLVEEDRAGTWLLRVVDDGPGVDGEDLARLTQPAYRGGDARTRYPAGQGLGLPIALEVARRHGFDLRLSRATSGGLEVAFSGSSADGEALTGPRSSPHAVRPPGAWQNPPGHGQALR